MHWTSYFYERTRRTTAPNIRNSANNKDIPVNYLTFTDLSICFLIGWYIKYWLGSSFLPESWDKSKFYDPLRYITRLSWTERGEM